MAKRLLPVLLVALALAPAALSATTPTQLRTAILAAGRAQHSVHYVNTSTWAGHAVQIVGDVARTSGVQRIAYRKGARSGHVTVVLVPGTVYLRGDAFTLQSYMGFTKVETDLYANRWIAIPKGDPAFVPVAAAVTLDSALDDLTPQGTLARVADTTVGGRRVVGVRGTSLQSGKTVVNTLYGRASGAALPVRSVETTKGVRVVAVLGRWNERVSLPATRGAVAIAKVRTAGSGPTA